MDLLSWFKGKEKCNWDSEDITFQLCKQSDKSVYSALKDKFLKGNLRLIYSKNCIPDVKSGKQHTLSLDTSHVQLYTEVYLACFNEIKASSKQFDHRIMGYAIKIDGVINNIFLGTGTDVNIIGLNYRKNSEEDYHFGIVGRKSAIKKYLEKICKDKNFWIEDHEEGCVLHNVVHNGRRCNIGWVFKPLNGHVIQENHLKVTKNSRIRVPSSVIYHTSLEMLYNNKDHSDEKQRSLVDIMKRIFNTNFSLGKPYLCTSSLAVYGGVAEDGCDSDRIIHNLGYDDEQKIELEGTGFAGGRGDIQISSSNKDIENIIHAILGTKDLDKVEKVYKWLSGKQPILLTQPLNIKRRCVVLGNAEPHQFEIALTGDLKATRTSNGVVVEYD